MEPTQCNQPMKRRHFLQSAAAAGAGLVFAPTVLGQAGSQRPDDINVALIGAGQQGYVLMTACLKIPGVRFRAVCDIWEDWHLKARSNLLKKYGHANSTYTDYREMLDKEKDHLDAVIVATPDFWHARHTVASLEAGLHVYCEKEMSNRLDDARRMVEAARKTGKLLQIGHQRRSNPRYLHCYEKLIKQAGMLGRIVNVNGQWNRTAREPFGWPKNKEIADGVLEKYGYESMQQFRNWRWYKGLGGGPMVDLGSHQIDVYDWFLDAHPETVVADGGTDYYDKNSHQWHDNVMAVYTYRTEHGVVRALYQTLSANSSNGYFETFMGDEGTLIISEASYRGHLYPEPGEVIKKWGRWVKEGLVVAPKQVEDQKIDETQKLYVGGGTPPTLKRPCYSLPIEMNVPYHQPHLENFFDSIRGKARLNCSAEVGYQTAVAVLKVNEAIAAEKKLRFRPEEFALAGPGAPMSA